MSIIEQAKIELEYANFGAEDSAAMIAIIEKFFDQWDSGGAVSVAAPVLMRLIAGKPLSPLTGGHSEWIEQAEGVFQNRRCGTVFKEKDINGKWIVYDIDRKPSPMLAGYVVRHRWEPCEITFPYSPDKAEVRPPVIEMGG